MNATTRVRTWTLAVVTVLALVPGTGAGRAGAAAPAAGAANETAQAAKKGATVSQQEKQEKQDTFGIANAARAEPGVLTAGQPTREQLGQAAAAGYRSVIDLRAPSEQRDFDEPAAARELGLGYVNLPVVLAELDGATLDRFSEVFAAAERPVLLHCASSGRVGGLLYAHLVLKEGVPEEQALERARAAGLTNPELTAKMQALVRARKAQ